MKIARVGLVIAVVLTGVIGFSSCEKFAILPPVINQTDSIYYQTDIQPIFNANCITCHSGGIAPDLRSSNSYNALSTGGFLTPNNETCPLYVQVTSAGHTARTTDLQKLQRLTWLKQGAKNNIKLSN